MRRFIASSCEAAHKVSRLTQMSSRSLPCMSSAVADSTCAPLIIFSEGSGQRDRTLGRSCSTTAAREVAMPPALVFPADRAPQEGGACDETKSPDRDRFRDVLQGGGMILHSDKQFADAIREKVSRGARLEPLPDGKALPAAPGLPGLQMLPEQPRRTAGQNDAAGEQKHRAEPAEAAVARVLLWFHVCLCEYPSCCVCAPSGNFDSPVVRLPRLSSDLGVLPRTAPRPPFGGCAAPSGP